jgi:hypothetical protein
MCHLVPVACICTPSGMLCLHVSASYVQSINLKYNGQDASEGVLKSKFTKKIQIVTPEESANVPTVHLTDHEEAKRIGIFDQNVGLASSLCPYAASSITPYPYDPYG